MFQIDDLSESHNNLESITQSVRISELENTLKKCKGTTPSTDKITYSMIKNSCNLLKERICKLYTNILQTGIYPHDWKNALLVPIPKSGKNANRLEGYRPVSLLPVLSKVFDKILARRILKFAGSNLFKEQHAFLPKRGVHSLCHQLEFQIKRNTTQGKHSIVLSEDLEKAFDKVVVTHVIEELHLWNVPNSILKLVWSFLTYRRISVRVDGFISRSFMLDNGTPQGSPLSVMVYTIYANSLIRILKNCPGIDYFGIYADNIFAVASGSTMEIEFSLNHFDGKIKQWADEKGAVIPIETAEALHTCRRYKCDLNPIRIRNKEVVVKKNMRVLGITFSKNTLWDEHIKKIIDKLKKINNLLKVICSRKKGPHFETAIQICRTLTEGTFQHCITIYGWTSEENKKKLNSAINNCFRSAGNFLRPTRIESLRIEAGYEDFEAILFHRSVKLAAKSLTCVEESLHELFWDVWKNRKVKTQKLKHNSILNICKYLEEKHIPIPEKPKDKALIKGKLKIDISLSSFDKKKSPPLIYKQLFKERTMDFAPDSMIYTDGSNRDGISSYAVVLEKTDDEFEIIQDGILSPYAGVFISELEALRIAVKYASSSKKKTLICSDSLSVLKSLYNNNKNYNTYIINDVSGDICNIKLLWIPSHIGIKGNENADEAAKDASRKPRIFQTPCIEKAITNYYMAHHILEKKQKWNESSAFLRSFNKDIVRPTYNYSLSRDNCIKIARLRVGKPLFSTQHIYNKTNPLQCSSCHINLTVQHIFCECPLSRTPDPLETIFDCSKTTNLKVINNALAKHNVFFKI